jgi:hypothetical protein
MKLQLAEAMVETKVTVQAKLGLCLLKAPRQSAQLSTALVKKTLLLLRVTSYLKSQ